MKCIIMAGGKGTRLWPISRINKPKQFQSLFSEKTMLQETFLRIRNKFPIKDIYISTNKEYVGEVEKEILELPEANLIIEPQARDRAPSMALSAAIISKKNSREIMAFFPADHIITNPDLLMRAVAKAEVFIKKHQDYIVSFGIKPTSPDTGLGYIEKGLLIKNLGSFSVCKVNRFVEKPDMTTAEKYLGSGSFFWNSGIYICRADALIKKFKKYVPDTYNRLIKIKKTVGTKKYQEVLAAEYPQMDKINIEYSVVENDDKVAVIPLALRWSDIGSWAALKDFLIKEKREHYVKGEHIDFDSENLLVYGSNKLITTIGVKDLIIVDTEDAILICDRNKSQSVSAVVKKLEESGKIKLL